MAKILVTSDDGKITVPVTDEGSGEPWYQGRCPDCKTVITDRGHLADTIEAVSLHLDFRHES